MNRKKQREDGDLDWLSSNGLPNNTEEKPKPEANLAWEHLFGSICQGLGSFLVRYINEICSHSFHVFLSGVFVHSGHDGLRPGTATRLHAHCRCDLRSHDCRV